MLLLHDLDHSILALTSEIVIHNRKILAKMQTYFRQICFLLVVLPLCSQGQVNLWNDFDGLPNMAVSIDSSLSENSWQVGSPQKTLFDSAYSPVNAMITDTASTYPTSNLSRFQAAIDVVSPFGTAMANFDWQQKIDMDSLDGGWVEVSYNEGVSWNNVFNDVDFNVQTSFPPTELSNGEFGFTGTDTNWQIHALAWDFTSGITFPPPPIIYIRFVFFSDSIETNQEGWMIDDLQATVIVFDFADEEQGFNSEIDIYPNPASSELTISLSGQISPNYTVEVLNLAGQVILLKSRALINSGTDLFKLDISELTPAQYHLRISGERGSISRSFLKLE